jgi:deoxycytidylate deaminase
VVKKELHSLKTLHAEENALLRLREDPYYAYITGAPCPNCLGKLIDKGVREIIILDRRGYSKEDGRETIDMLLHQSGAKVRKVNLPFALIAQTVTPPRLMYAPTELYD